MKNFKEIPIYTKKAFEELCNGNNTKLKELLNIKTKLDLDPYNKVLAEIYWNDFSVNWNKLQSSYFIKENILLDTGNKIPYFASEWIYEWKKYIYQTEAFMSIEDVFDMRKFNFETYKSNVDKLKIIFSKVFKITEKDFNKCLNIQKNLINAYLYSPNKESNQNCLAYMIYAGATLEYFNKVFVKNPNCTNDFVKFMINFHYGMQNENKDEKIEILFNTNIYNRTKQEKIEEILNFKEKELSLRDEDAKYWKYYLSIIDNDKFVKILKESFDVKISYEPNKDESKSVGMRVFIKNNHYLLTQELCKNKDTVFVRKKIKI